MISRSRVLKFVIVGDGGVGKTTLAKVFCINKYIDQIMTIGIDIHTKESLVNGERITLQILDISGQSQFKFLLPDFIRNANGIILAFECTNNASFLNLKDWLQIIRSKEPKVPIFLIATKVDEDYDPALSMEKIKEFIQANSLIGFEETSAKLNLNVGIPFKRLLEYIYHAEPDTIPITFYGAEIKPEFTQPEKAIKETPLPESSSSFDLHPEPEILTEIESNAKQIADTPNNSISALPYQDTSRISNYLTNCPHCNASLRKSQIKLKLEGREVFCQNCMRLI